MNISIRDIIENDLMGEFQNLVRNCRLSIITAGQIGRLMCDMNRFKTGAMPVINQQRKVYTDANDLTSFDTSYEAFLDATESFDRPVMVITGYSQYHKPIFNGIIEFY